MIDQILTNESDRQGESDLESDQDSDPSFEEPLEDNLFGEVEFTRDLPLGVPTGVQNFFTMFLT